MSKKTLVLLGIIGLIIVFLICAFLHWRSIEKDIASCSTNILQNAKLTTLSANTLDRGRNVLISGTVTSKAQKQLALDLLKNKCNMTSLSNDITVETPEPSIQPFVNLRNNTVTGKLSSQQEVNNFVSGFNGNIDNKIKYDKQIIPSSLNSYVGSVIPVLSNITDYNIDINPNSITLKGLVSSEVIKTKIGQYIHTQLNGKVKLKNLLTIVAPKPVVKTPLDSKSCQQELSDLLSKSKIQFNSGSAVIKQESTHLLTSLASTTRSCQGVAIMIIGHTDSSGNAQSNLELSKNRSQAVANYLMETGVQQGKLHASGVGSSQPIAMNDTADGRTKNRRIEFKVKPL